VIELANAWYGIVGDHADSATSLRLGLDAVRIRDPTPFFDTLDDAVQRLTVCEREDRIDSIRCDC
jgi:hypothetical protein